MSIQNRSTSFLIAAGLVATMVPLLSTQSSMQQNTGSAEVKTAGGLQTATFDLPPGQVLVYLPDDMRAGDTISGTVVTQPKGNSSEDKEKNRQLLEGLVIEVGRKTVAAKNREFTIQPVFDIVPNELAAGQSTTVLVTIRNGNQKNDSNMKPNQPFARVVINTYAKITMPPQSLTAVFSFPALGQSGRPIVISGPFDGDSSNTSLNGTAVQDFEKNTENVSGGFGLIAESPRKAVFRAPTDVAGPMELKLKERNKDATGNYRNVGVNLSAPKTALLKGESTTVTIDLSGLQGIKQPVPLHLVKGGVVSMQGGDVQTMSIKPADVKADGTFTTARTITGEQTGAFSVVATVVVFDVCLEDDKNGNTIILNRETGDYIFCSGAKPMSLSTMDFGGGDSPQTGSRVDVNSKGGIFSLEHNAPDRRVLINLSGTSGTATVQTTNAKQKFTITDRDIRNNTCACR